MYVYDFFIAYASADIQYAERLHALLTAIGYRVFLDAKALIGGARWPEEILQAQWSSLATLVLTSDRCDSAFFQKEEILEAIELARQGRCRLVPLYLTNELGRATVRPQLRQLQGILWEQNSSLLSVALKIEAALNAPKRSEKWQHEIVAETVVIVTGCHHIPEIFDRPTAYELKASIDHLGRSPGRSSFLFSFVLGDKFFLDHSDIQGHPSVISIGSEGINRVTKIIAEQGAVTRDGERWKIVRSGNRWALFGNLAEDTTDAVSFFKDHYLPGFLRQLWLTR